MTRVPRARAAAVAAGGLGALMLGALFSCAPAERVATPRHLFLVVHDTLRADRLSVYGHTRPTSPFLEELASEALVFERFQAVAPWTVPTHATMFTGLEPVEHEAQWGRMKLAEEHQTLAEQLEDAGFCTAGLSANPLVRPNNGLAQGFAHYDVIGGPWAQKTDKLLARFAAQLDELQASGCGRVFFFLNLMNAHIPYSYDAERHGRPFEVEGPGPVKNAKIKWAISAGVEHFSDQDRSRHQRAYDAAVRALDDASRQIVDILAERGLLDHSLLALTSDHGEGLGFHREMGHSISVWEEQLEIPLIVRFPHGRNAGRVGARHSQLALAPALFDWLGVERPAAIAEASSLDDEPGSSTVTADYRSYFSESNRGTNLRMAEKYPQLVTSVGHRHVLYCEDSKLVVSPDRPPRFYDLASDPEEQHERASEAGPELRACVNAYRDLERRGAYTPFDLSFESDQPDLELLQSLGYVQ